MLLTPSCTPYPGTAACSRELAMKRPVQAPVVQSDGLGAEVSRFHTPIEAKGRIYLSTTDRLLAFEIGAKPASSAFAAPPCTPPPLIPAHPLVPVHACASCSGAQATIINVGMQKNSPIGDCCRGQQPG